MAQYAIAFDLNTVRMKNDGISDAERTAIYQTEIKEALTLAGFPSWIQGSVYRTDSEQSSLRIITNLQNSLKTHAPRFCKYVNKVHIFRIEDLSEITDLISTFEEPQM